MNENSKTMDNNAPLCKEIVDGDNVGKIADESLPRRAFLQGQFLKTFKTEQVQLQGYDAIRPPWADLANFLAKCTACQQCIHVCETQIIKQGKGGLPEIDFSKGECTFCQQCIDICSEPIFRDREESAWEHKVKVAESCLLNQKIECRSCGDYCESRAIRFTPQRGGIVALTLDLAQCNGCGACLSVCPTQAISVLTT